VDETATAIIIFGGSAVAGLLGLPWEPVAAASGILLVLTSVGTEPEPAADQTAGHQVLITYVSAYIGKAFVGAGQACLAWGLAVCVTLLF
jgi:hypothetical protein